ncbi:MAG: TnsD family Tn7-like transposition protein [Caldicoprobacterales bacterium]
MRDFKDYYGEEFLNAMQSNIEDNGQGQWIREVTHSDAKAMHPIRHLLLARFLGISLDTLFNKEICYKPFGDGPWLCLNPAADHFLEPVVKDVEIKYRRRNKNTNGFFRCSCGYEIHGGTVTREEGGKG